MTRIGKMITLGIWIAGALFFSGCGAGDPAGKMRSLIEDYDELPTLQVIGFSCELGGKKCMDRRVGRRMQDLTEKSLAKSGKFEIVEGAPASRQHLKDISGMLWTSGQSDVLKDLIDFVDSDFLAYGRVFDYDRSTRQLKVEITLVHRKSGRTYAVIGKGNAGSLAAAVKDAGQRIGQGLED